MSNEAAGGKTEAVKTANQIENRDLNRTCTQSGVKIDHCSRCPYDYAPLIFPSWEYLCKNLKYQMRAADRAER